MGLVEVIAPAQTESRLLFSAGAALALLVRRQLEPVVLGSRAASSSRPRWPAGGQMATWTR